MIWSRSASRWWCMPLTQLFIILMVIIGWIWINWSQSTHSLSNSILIHYGRGSTFIPTSRGLTRMTLVSRHTILMVMEFLSGLRSLIIVWLIVEGLLRVYMILILEVLGLRTSEIMILWIILLSLILLDPFTQDLLMALYPLYLLILIFLHLNRRLNHLLE